MTTSVNYILHLADSALVLSQRNSEWCGHGPILEQDIAITNISLDLLGQARNFYQYAATLIGNTDEDRLAYLRTEREYKNLLLSELPRGDWAQTVLRQYFFSQYYLELFTVLKNHSDVQLSAICEKALKEIKYHVRWSREWVIRLGDGTAESNHRMKNALIAVWPYTGEMFVPADYESGLELDFSAIQSAWTSQVSAVLIEAGFSVPEKVFMQQGGKAGVHTEYLGPLLAELQYMQRSFPGCEW